MNYGVIRSILLTVILLPAGWAAFGAESGTAVFAIVFAWAAYCLVSGNRWSRSIRIVAVLLGLAAVTCLAPPAVDSAREAARCISCTNNLRQIGLAVRNYRDVYGSYPPTSTYDQSGRPLHSWRLLLKPFLDSSNTYYQCNLSEPWDSPGNQGFLAERQYMYKCPMDQTAYAPDSTTTSYVVIVGSKAAWRHPYDKTENTDGKPQNQSADAFLVIEMANSGIQWSEPKDIDFDDVEALKSLAARSPHVRDNGYFYCKTPAVNSVLVHGDMVFVFPWDSRTSLMTGLLPPEELLLPPEDLERLNREKYSPYSQLFHEELQVDWPHVVGLPVWIVAVALVLRMVCKQTIARHVSQEVARGHPA